MAKWTAQSITDLELELRGYAVRISKIVKEIEDIRDWVDGPTNSPDHADWDTSLELEKLWNFTFKSLAEAARSAGFFEQCLDETADELESAADSFAEFEAIKRPSMRR